MTEPLLWFNGVDAATGEYISPPMTVRQMAEIVRGKRPERVPARDVREDLESDDLSQVGWGIIFPAKDPEDSDLPKASEIRDALSELLDWRRGQAGIYYHEFGGEDGVKPGEKMADFLVRHKTGPGTTDPEKMPYYLMLVGSPEAISYRFQHQLDLSYAVGRIHFDTLDEYRRYAQSVVAAEKASPRSSRAVLFGPCHPNDPPTHQSMEELIIPLAQGLKERTRSWQIDSVLADEATKEQLGRLMGGDDTPAFLFTAGHGIMYSQKHSLQPQRQGAVLCQGWQGPGTPALADYYFTGDDLLPDAGLKGLVTFHFACYSAGTPHTDEFAVRAVQERDSSALKPFLSHLSRRLLSHPMGGSLAVVGHVDRAWQASFFWPGVGRTLQAFEDMMIRLLKGFPVGAAMEPFRRRHADLAARLCNELQDGYGGELSDESLASLWTACNDARNYVVVGDPAVRIHSSGTGS